MLRDSTGRKLWAQGISRPPPSFLPPGVRPLPHDLVLTLDGQDAKRFEELAEAFMTGAVGALRRSGYADDLLTFHLHFQRSKSRVMNRVLVTGLDEVAARALYCRFRQYTWSGDAYQFIRVSLSAKLFDEEFEQEPRLRLMPRAILSPADSVWVGVHRSVPLSITNAAPAAGVP